MQVDMKSVSARVLLVEDDEKVCEFWQDALSEHGFRVDLACGLEDLKNQLIKFSYDFVLLDKDLRTESFTDSISYILKESPRTKILVLTTEAQVDSAVEALQAGATDYVAKDIEAQVLVEKLRSYFRKSRPIKRPGFSELGFKGKGKRI